MNKAIPLMKLGEVCEFVRGPFGGSLKKSCFVSSGYAVYEQQHAINDQFTRIRYFIDETKFVEMKRFKLNSGDLIMSCSGTMGKVAVVPKGIPTGIINQALLKLTPRECLNVYYLKYWMESPNFQLSLSNFSKGVAIKNVASVKILKEIEIPIPPISEQKFIVKALSEVSHKLFQARFNVKKKLELLDEMEKSILNNAFLGKLSISKTVL